MINGQSILAVIPARAGSKRCPDKNLREFRGRQLIHWSLDAAHRSKYIDRCCVSSDSKRILQLAISLGAETLVRPDYLADDGATNEAVLIHMFYAHRHDWLVLLQPTSPLRTAADIDATIEIAVQDGDGAVSVREDGTRNGAVYVVRSTYLASRLKLADKTTYRMPDERSLDIDYPADFDR